MSTAVQQASGLQPGALPQGRTLDDLTQLFKALGDPSRVRIMFRLFAAEACVSEIAQAVPLSGSAVSHHLHILRMNGLVQRHRRGKRILYQMDDAHVRAILAQGCDHIREKQNGRQTESCRR